MIVLDTPLREYAQKKGLSSLSLVTLPTLGSVRQFTSQFMAKGYFSLNDFYACAACNGPNSKE